MPFTISEERALLFHDIQLAYPAQPTCPTEHIQSLMTEGYEVVSSGSSSNERLIVEATRIDTNRTDRLTFKATVLATGIKHLVIDFDQTEAEITTTLSRRLGINRPDDAHSSITWVVNWPPAEWLSNGWFIPKRGRLTLEYESQHTAHLPAPPPGAYTTPHSYRIVNIEVIHRANQR